MAKPKITPLAINQPLTQEDIAKLGPKHEVTGPTMTDDELEALEQRIYEAQEALIRAEYNKEAAELANYGWAVEVNEDNVGVATKVYLPSGTMILDSEAGADGIIKHEWVKY